MKRNRYQGAALLATPISSKTFRVFLALVLAFSLALSPAPALATGSENASDTAENATTTPDATTAADATDNAVTATNTTDATATAATNTSDTATAASSTSDTTTASDATANTEDNGLLGVPWYWTPDAVTQGTTTSFSNFDPTADRDQLIERWKTELLAWTIGTINITITKEKMDEIMGRSDYAPAEVGVWWNSYSQQLHTDTRAAIVEATSPMYDTYLDDQQGYMGSLSFDGQDQTTRDWKFQLRSSGKRDSYDQELEVRKKLQSIYAPGGALYSYRAATDLYSDQEKYRAVWDWFTKNVYYSYTSSSPYGVIVKGGGICQGYSLANAIMCAYAGLDVMCVTGWLGNWELQEVIGHAWSWVRIGDKWVQSDTTSNSEEPDRNPFFEIK